MKHKGSWMAKMVALAVVAMVGAVVAAMDPTGAPMTDTMFAEAAAFTPSDDPAPECQADLLSTVKLHPDEGVPEPVAICRLFPECWTNSDCDARCGVGLGKCVHSNCPPRLCRCR